jgi:hypothetical protein
MAGVEEAAELRMKMRVAQSAGVSCERLEGESACGSSAGFRLTVTRKE